jgi:hypothetical protein
LCAKVAKALKSSGGASSEYQNVIIELHGLQNVLARLAALEPTEGNINHVNAIRGMALACQLPLREFLSKLEKYETTMGPLATGTMRSVGKKAKWAILMEKEVKKIRALVSAKVLSISLLLATHTSETLSRMEHQAGLHQERLFEKLEEHWISMDMSHETARREAESSSSRIESKIDNICGDTTGIIQHLAALSISLASAQSSLINLRNLGSQFMVFLQSFPAELRMMLQNIICTNMRMYFMLLNIHNRVSACPTLLLQSNIHFEDALGVVRELPYEWFHHWEVSLDALLLNLLAD